MPLHRSSTIPCRPGIGATRPDGYATVTLNRFRAARESKTRRIPSIFDAAAVAPCGALASHAEASAMMYACEGGRDGRVVDGGGLENHCARKGTGGSNPSPSAKSQTSGCRGPRLCKTVPIAARRDRFLYEVLVLLDALRDGRAREKRLAEKQLISRVRRPAHARS